MRSSQRLASSATVCVLVLYIAMAAISPITLTEINSAAADALKLIPGEEAAGLVTVVCGYTELAAMNPSNSTYIERYFEAVCKLAEFVMERGRHILARRLLLLANDIKRSSSGMSQRA